MEKNSKIFVAGHRGLVGSAIANNLHQKGYTNLITRSHTELNLTSQEAVAAFFREEQPEYVFLAAAKVGGIGANTKYRGEFIYENLLIQTHVIHNAYRYGARKLLFLGSTCIYPREAPQPLQEEALLTAPLEYTNEPYAIAKIAGLKMCESYNLQYGTNFISVMPTNLYGPGDNFDLERSHVLPALLRKIHLAKALDENNIPALKADFAKIPVEGVDGNDWNALYQKLEKYGIRRNPDGSTEVEIWGTGTPLREFLWSEDMADACVHLMEHVDFPQLVRGKTEIRNTHVNIGTGQEISIRELVQWIVSCVGYRGKISFNPQKPDGTPRKLCDVNLLQSFGWHHQTQLDSGIQKLYNWYLAQQKG